MSYQGCDVMSRAYVDCLDVTACLFGTIVTQVIVYTNKKLVVFFPSRPQWWGRGESSIAYAYPNRRPASIDEQL